MRKLVTTLLIILPIIFLIALLAITTITAINAEIAVTSLTIKNKGDGGVFLLDMADYSAPLYEEDLCIEVLPVEAKNKKYSRSVTSLDGTPSNIVTVGDDGAFILHDIGIAKLTYTSKDGDFSDSVILNITSTGVISYTPVLQKKSGETIDIVNNEVEISTGSYVLSSNIYPNNITSINQTFSSSTEAINMNQVTGEFDVYFSGQRTVKMGVDTVHGFKEKEILLNVKKSSSNTVNGINIDSAKVYAPLNATSFSFYLETAKDTLSAEDIIVSQANLKSFNVEKLSSISDSAYRVTVELNDAIEEDTSIRYSVKIDGESEGIYVDFTSYNFNVYIQNSTSGKDSIILYEGEEKTGIITVTPSNNFSYDYYIADETIASVVSFNGNTFILKANGIGSTILQINWKLKDANGNILNEDVEIRKVVVASNYSSMLFLENASTYGLGTLSIASSKYVDGEEVQISTPLEFVAYSGTTKLSPEYKDIEFISSNAAIAEITSNSDGVFVNIKANGQVTILASSKYNSLITASLTFNAVNGIEASTYNDLVLASKNKKQIVLNNDIHLGVDLFSDEYVNKSDSEKKAILQSEIQEIETTWDWTYYKNIGQEHPKLKVAYEITNNLYGNGHTISAEYITNMLDSTGNLYDYAVFKGPLDFVSTSKDGIVLAGAKGQDNISFLCRNDNVIIDNVSLKGCDDESIYDGDAIDLTLLNYAGTTLELMANVTVSNSRLSNGRTVLRAYGRYGIDNSVTVNQDLERIYVNVNNCKLFNSREFLLKIGSNRFIQDSSNPSPSLLDQNGNSYSSNCSKTDSNINDSYFMNNYVLTDITVKDSSFKACGIFAVGVEAHFSGPMLNATDDTFLLDGWYNLAATSYASILHLVGDVKFETWTAADSIDSSTLIETASTSSSLSFLSLNISKILTTVQIYGGEEYKNVISKYNDKDYVHCGIAMYGGGKNYSIIDTSKLTSEMLHQYTVNLGILSDSSDEDLKNQGTYLPHAAGYNDFRFFMYDASSNYTYEKQIEVN